VFFEERRGRLYGFRWRDRLSGAAVVGLAALALPLLGVEAPHLWRGLLGVRAAPALVTGVAAALLSGPLADEA